MREKIDIHAHYFPPAYDQMLEKRGMKRLDGGFPKPEWNEDIQLCVGSTDQQGRHSGKDSEFKLGNL